MLWRQSADRQGIEHPLAQFRLARQAVLQQRFADGVAHAQARIQRAVRILKHQLHFRPQGAQRLFAQAIQRLPFEHHLAGGFVVQAKQRAANGGFAAAGLAHQPENAALANAEADVVHRLQLAAGSPEQPVAQREIFL